MGRRPIYHKVYHQLRYQILSGERPIGSQMPPERKLAEELGVSRNTVVRAYDELEAEGFIAGRMGSGRYVQPLPPASSLSRIDWQGGQPLDSLIDYPSHMADLLSVFVHHPDSFNFAHGEGGKHTVKTSGFAEYLRTTSERLDSYYFTAVQGHPLLREQIVKWMDVEQVSSPEQVLITSGSQEGLYLIARLLARPGDAVVTEMPTYFGSLQLFQSLGMRIIPIPMDAHGMDTHVLESVLARYRPRFLYTVPTFHNPTGATLSLERRKQLLAISEKYQLPIVEDDAYRHLHLEEEPPPPLKQLDDSGRVIYLNTFSKILFPGLRIGWIAATRPIIQMLSRFKELSITTNTLGQVALAEYLRDQRLAPHLAHVRSLYREQAQAMEVHLARLKDLGISYEKPFGGFYYWVSLPEEIHARSFMKACQARGVSITCGDMFLLREAEQRFIRLCYTHEPSSLIEQGMSILSEVLRKELSR
jgi:DNA-binding transcriptional MocR family regulator